MLDWIVMAAGFVVAAALIFGLIAGNLAPQFRIWPAPPSKSLKSFAVWTLFRTLNLAVLFVCAANLARDAAAGELISAQILAAAAAVLAFGAYLWTLWALGRKATYCRASGLAQEGVYAWSRNPQYATAIAAYFALGIATASALPAALAIALVAVYALMAIAEEPWLEATYAESYRTYRARVPRFFDGRRLLTEAVKFLRPRRTPHETSAVASAARLRRPRP